MMAGSNEKGRVVLTEEEKRRQRVRSIALAFALGALVVIFFLVTIVRLGGNVFNRPI
jgi:predicted nucleic acid-binding Zn ribbon protein